MFVCVEETTREIMRNPAGACIYAGAGTPAQVMENYFYPKKTSVIPQIQTAQYYAAEDLPPPIFALRYYLPLEILVNELRSGRFHYCCYVYPFRQIIPVGYCAEGCTGHPSREEAREHYRQYLVDRFGRYDGRFSAPCACTLCGRSTTYYAKAEFHYEWDAVGLCQTHLNSEGLAAGFVFSDYHLLQLSPSVGDETVTIQEHLGVVSIVRHSSEDRKAKELPSPAI